MNIHIANNTLKSIYETSKKNLIKVRKWSSSALTLSEKILYSHLCEPQKKQIRGKGFLSLQPDRIAMQDVTAQMALLQFMLTKKTKTAVPTTVHCDHLIRAWKGVQTDIKNSLAENNEVFNFLSSACNNFNIGFWKPGTGIIHQVFLENYAFPGGLLIGTDSHTPNAGGLGMLAVGVGGADATDVMAGMPWEVKNPKILGVHLTGKLNGWASSKDIILTLLGILTVKGGTNKIIEYFGDGCTSLSCTGKATITNMGAELGATCSIFPYDLSMSQYLQATGRSNQVKIIADYQDMLVADPEVIKNPHNYYDEIIEINLTTLEPQLAGPHSPDIVHSLSEIKTLCKTENWPVKLSAALIGSCTNSSYEDIGRAAHVARQAHKWNLQMPQHFLVTPGSELIKQTIKRDNYIKDFESIGAIVLANACGPCIGQWRRDTFKKGQPNTIVNSFNRNFRGRNDANPDTFSFIASPEITIALGLAGRLDFNPQTDLLKVGNKKIKLTAPQSDILPKKGFVISTTGYVPPTKTSLPITILPQSNRLQVLKPFPPWSNTHFTRLIILCKAQGKCTTDHISPAGFWLKYRGHLNNLSDNLLSGATNFFTQKVGSGVNILTKETQSFAEIARYYKSQNRHWIIIGDENYGEGSSREHAAMTPRYLGAKAVIVNSFARIHETNLKKQGVLPLTFVTKTDINKFRATDEITILNLENIKPNSTHILRILHSDGSQEEISVVHSLNSTQIKWFKSGSALNFIRNNLIDS